MNQDDVEKRLNPNAGLTAKADDSKAKTIQTHNNRKTPLAVQRN